MDVNCITCKEHDCNYVFNNPCQGVVVILSGLNFNEFQKLSTKPEIKNLENVMDLNVELNEIHFEKINQFGIKGAKNIKLNFQNEKISQIKT